MTPSLIWGNILHEVMQACLCEGRWDSAWLDAQIGDVVRRSLGDLMRVNMSIEQAVSEVRLRAQGLRSFADKYMSDTPKASAPLSLRALQCLFLFLLLTGRTCGTAGSAADEHALRRGPDVPPGDRTAARH